MSDEMDTAADNRAESPAPAEPAVEKLDTGDAPSAIKEISGDAAVDESKIAGEAGKAQTFFIYGSRWRWSLMRLCSSSRAK